MCLSHSGGAESFSGPGTVGSALDREILPQNVKPLHYNVTLEPNFDNFTFEGSVIIE